MNNLTLAVQYTTFSKPSRTAPPHRAQVTLGVDIQTIALNFVNVLQLWLQIDPTELVEQLGNFPSEQIRVEIAQAILKRSEYSRRTRTSERQARLHSYLRGEDSN